MSLIRIKNNCIQLFLLATFFSFTFSNSNASPADSLKNKSFQFFLSDDIKNKIDASIIDSGLTRFQITNPYFNNYTTTFGFLGNLGSALRSNYFGLHDDLNFYYRANYFEGYNYNGNPIGFDKLRNIHSKMEYYRGAKKEQLFQFSHYQRLSKNFGIGLDYGSIVSPSFYKHAVTNGKQFDFFLLFETGNNKYSAFAEYVSNKTDNNENGGLVSDTSLKNASGIDVKTLPVNSADAQWLTKQKDFVFKQQFNFNFAAQKLVNNTSDSSIKSTLINTPKTFLHHDLKFATNSELFTASNDSLLWNQNYYDTITTIDSSTVKQLLNTVYFQSVLLNENYQWKAGATNQYLILKQRDIDSAVTHTSVFAALNLEFTKQLNINFNYEQNVSGDANSAYLMKGAITYSFSDLKFGKLGFEFLSIKQPSFIVADVYHTNHFKWDNNFALINRNEIHISYSHKLFETGVRIYNLKNYVYYNSAENPQQDQASVGYTDAYLKFNIRLNKWNWINDFDFVSDGNSRVIKLPTINLHTSIFYDDYIFKGAMRAQVGFDVFYNSTYYADGFMPGLQQFYVQDKIKIGNYPFIDFFASGRIKTAKIFVKLENIGSGWMGKNYFSSPNYPLQGRGIRLGLQWSFFN